MRILGQIDHPILKITVFHMNNRISVKFESGLYEQTYKLREQNHIRTLEDVKQWLDPSFIGAVQEMLAQMHQTKMAAFERMSSTTEEEEFEEII